jgi:hypothetical protein
MIYGRDESIVRAVINGASAPGRGVEVGKIKEAAGGCDRQNHKGTDPTIDTGPRLKDNPRLYYGQSGETCLIDLTLKWDVCAASLSPRLLCFWPMTRPVTSTFWPT